IRVPVWSGVADAPIREIELGIVRAGHPDRSAAMLPRFGVAVGLRLRRTGRPAFEASFTWTRNGVEPPRFLAGSRVVRGDEPANAVLTAADSDDDLVLDDERRERQRVAGLALRHFRGPHRAAALRVD